MGDAVTVALITGLSAIAVAAAPLLAVMYRYHHQLTAKVEQVHVLVNSQKEEAERYTALLIAALEAGSLKVPDRPPEHKEPEQ